MDSLVKVARSGSFRRRVAVSATALLLASAAVAAEPALAASSRSQHAASKVRETAAVITPSEDCLQGVPAFCYAPGPFSTAYGTQPLLQEGIDGKGETIVLPEEAVSGSTGASPGVSDIRTDLATFDAMFALPAATVQVDDTLGPTSTPWLAGAEEVEDVEVAHAVAPGASIVVDLVPATATASPANFVSAFAGVLGLAASQGAAVVSVGASVGEDLISGTEVASIQAALRSATENDITVVASSGDSGAISDQGPPKQVSLPASAPLVLGVGGTSLDANPVTGAYLSETAWNFVVGVGDDDASAGGFSDLFARPDYQDGTVGGAARGVPDVAADADASTGMALVTVTTSGSETVLPATGTSAAAPFWASIIALADQLAGHHLGFVNAGIYRIGRSPAYHQAFHAVTAGDNSVLTSSGVVTGYQATDGWNPVTGWGSPDAAVLVPLLVQEVHADDAQGL
jgi:subtilase family serine protease